MVQGVYKGLKGVGKSVRKVVEGIESRAKARQDFKRAKIKKTIEQNFGSVENYMDNYR